MKVLMINGSPHSRGCTYTALMEIASVLDAAQVQWEIVDIGTGPVQDCIACGQCKKNGGKCTFDDIANKIIEKAETADGIVFGSPVYYAHPSGRILSVLDRVFYAGGAAFAHKPAAAIVSARRAGTTASVDVLNKYFTIAQMPVVASTYWNMVHGNSPEDVRQDLEGLETMRNIGRNMVWLLRCIAAGKDSGVPAPAITHQYFTNFVR